MPAPYRPRFPGQTKAPAAFAKLPRLLDEKLARHAAQRRLSALSGTMPDLDLPPR